MIYLYNGDCLEIMDNFIKQDIKTNFSFTSPPYNRKRNDKYNNYEDTETEYYQLLTNSVDKMLAISKYVFFNIQKNYYNKKDVFKFIGKYSEKIIDIIIWTKSNPMPASGFNITNAYEFIIILSNTETSIKAKETYTKNHIETNVYSENPYKKIHRAVMKPDVVTWFIKKFTTKNNTILDPFMGLGTTGIICKELDRNFLGIELDEEYFKIAQGRINDALETEPLFKEEGR